MAVSFGTSYNRRKTVKSHCPADLPANELIAGRFKIIRFLERGGMGEVYEAEDLELYFGIGKTR